MVIPLNVEPWRRRIRVVQGMTEGARDATSGYGRISPPHNEAPPDGRFPTGVKKTPGTAGNPGRPRSAFRRSGPTARPAARTGHADDLFARMGSLKDRARLPRRDARAVGGAHHGRGWASGVGTRWDPVDGSWSRRTGKGPARPSPRAWRPSRGAPRSTAGRRSRHRDLTETMGGALETPCPPGSCLDSRPAGEGEVGLAVTVEVCDWPRACVLPTRVVRCNADPRHRSGRRRWPPSGTPGRAA